MHWRALPAAALEQLRSEPPIMRAGKDLHAGLCEGGGRLDGERSKLVVHARIGLVPKEHHPRRNHACAQGARASRCGARPRPRPTSEAGRRRGRRPGPRRRSRPLGRPSLSSSLAKSAARGAAGSPLRSSAASTAQVSRQTPSNPTPHVEELREPGHEARQAPASGCRRGASGPCPRAWPPRRRTRRLRKSRRRACLPPRRARPQCGGFAGEVAHAARPEVFVEPPRDRLREGELRHPARREGARGLHG